MVLMTEQPPDLDWTTIGMEALPEEEREGFLAALDAVQWLPPRGTLPTIPALALKEIVSEFRITPVTALSYNVLHGPYTVLGVRTRLQAMYFLDLGTKVTPILIARLPEPMGPLCGCGAQLPPTADLALHRAAAKCDG